MNTAVATDAPTAAPLFSRTAIAWAIMLVTIALEVCGTTAMKMVGKSKWWYVAVYGFYAASLGLFPLALERIPLSVAYAVWSGVGTSVTVLVATALFKERLTWQMGLSIVMIIVGVVSLNYLQNQASRESESALLAAPGTTASNATGALALAPSSSVTVLVELGTDGSSSGART